ncbi:MAG: protein-glutamate O-methyltransferase CheR [Candidatus Omnitrophica bacterium]|nr:protein-glutamate O-methyltransferase CheR [Candidatus Omnitrophota bacterium]
MDDFAYDNSSLDNLEPKELMAINQILEDMHANRGVDFRNYRPKCLRRRLLAGMHDVRLNSFVEYSNFLRKNPQEYEKLLYKIAINVSEFFRNPTVFQAIQKKVIPAIVENKKEIGGNIIRIWSAGCATGEEPYSLAILFKETLDMLDWKNKISLFATDIDNEALEKARAGVYKQKALKELSKFQVKRYFDQTGEDVFAIKDEIKEMVTFKTHDMIASPPLARVDLILCRNVVIYFTKELQAVVYENFSQALASKGFLVAGKTEVLWDFEGKLFDRVDSAERIFKKKEVRNSCG